MNTLNSLQRLFDLKPHKKSRLSKLFADLRYYLWLHTHVRKKSHKIRMNKARGVFQTLQRPEFKTEPSRLFAYIRTIDPFVFEELLLIAFKARGLKVIHNKRYTGDGGIDGILILPSKHRIALQAKRYRNHINVQHVRDFSQRLKAHGCHGGYFIHCGKTGAAVYEQRFNDITLISGANLHRLLTDF
ncbi:restriction endonuclease [Legionella lytica]|uniref:Restriction endonuclease n=1 Tax=Legionella lytica TaxID=96232 RepID=A0ABW8DBA9_9GAMM